MAFKEKTFVENGCNTDIAVQIDLEKEILKEKVNQLTEQNEKLQKIIDNLKSANESKKKFTRKVDPPLISVKAFMTPSKPLSFREPKVDLTPKSKNSVAKPFKK